MNSQTSAAGRKTRQTGIAPAATTPSIAVIVVLLAAGLAGRVWLNHQATRYGYWGDHVENISMAQAAEQYGLFNLYAARHSPTVKAYMYESALRPPVGVTWRIDHGPNYPPLGVTLLWLSAKAGGFASSDAVVNTFTSRLVMSALTVAGELLCAVLAWLVVSQLAGPKAAIWAAGVCWLMPPLAMDSCFWGQTDSFFLAPAMLLVYLLMRQRWWLCGAVLGAAAMIKPQAVLLLPVVAFAAIIMPPQQQWLGTVKTAAVRLGKMAATSLAGIALISLPWTIAGGLDWLRQSYLENLQQYPMTTLKAFNFWYLDLLRLDASQWYGADSPAATVLGLSKDAWGKVLALVAMAGAGAMCWRKLRSRPGLAVVFFAGLCLWTAFMLPTRVHERYIVYCMPAVIAAAACLKRLAPAVVILAAVGAAELSWNTWLTLPAGEFTQQAVQLRTEDYYLQMKGAAVQLPTSEQVHQELRRQYEAGRESCRPWEYLLTLVSMAGFVYTFTAILLHNKDWNAHGRISPADSSTPRRRRRGSCEKF